MSTNPAALCASKVTVAKLNDIQADTIRNALDTVGSESDQRLANEALAKDRLFDVNSYDNIVMSGYDQVTKKVNCNSDLAIAISPFALNSMKLDKPPRSIGRESVIFDINYSIQLSADGKELVYSLEGANDLSSVSARAALLKVAAKTQVASNVPSEQPTSSPNEAREETAPSTAARTCLGYWSFIPPGAPASSDEAFSIHIPEQGPAAIKFTDFSDISGTIREDSQDGALDVLDDQDGSIMMHLDCRNASGGHPFVVYKGKKLPLIHTPGDIMDVAAKRGWTLD